MRADYLVDLSGAGSGLVRFRAEFSGLPPGSALRLPARLARVGVEVCGLRAADAAGKPLRLKARGERISVPARAFVLEYSLHISFKECAGTDKEIELLYPFLNGSELFLGSGALAYPEDLRRLAPRLKASLRVEGLPAGWRLFSSLAEGPVSPAALDSFFLYFSKRSPRAHAYRGLACVTDFSLLVQAGKTIPLGAPEVWAWTDMVMGSLEKYLSPYRGFKKLSVLLLQCPADFEQLTGGRAFAAGENVAGGILAYTPKSPEYIKRRYGYTSYAYHLRDGLAHELTHFYSTGAWQGRYKSMLFPAEVCPPQQRRLIGEALTAYFHNGVIRCRPGAKPSFISGKILPALRAWALKPGKRPLLDLFLLDLWLRAGGSSLAGAVRRLLRECGAKHRPYRSALALVRAAEACRSAALPAPLKKAILTEYAPDYAGELAGFPGWNRPDFSPLRG